MSVTTTADEKRMALVEKLKVIRNESEIAIRLAGEMIDPDTWGGDDWNEEFVDLTSSLITFLTEVSLKIRREYRSF